MTDEKNDLSPSEKYRRNLSKEVVVQCLQHECSPIAVITDMLKTAVHLALINGLTIEEVNEIFSMEMVQTVEFIRKQAIDNGFVPNATDAVN